MKVRGVWQEGNTCDMPPAINQPKPTFRHWQFPFHKRKSQYVRVYDHAVQGNHTDDLPLVLHRGPANADPVH